MCTTRRLSLSGDADYFLAINRCMCKTLQTGTTREEESRQAGRQIEMIGQGLKGGGRGEGEREGVSW